MEEKGKALLQSESHIIERILRHFSAREILRVAGICRMWQKSAVTVLTRRSRLATMTAANRSQQNAQMTIVDDAETKEFLRNRDIKCEMAFMFQSVGHRSFKHMHDKAIANFGAIHSQLPPSSAVIGAVSTAGIIGTSADRSCHELQNPESDCFSAFLLPSYSNEGTYVTHFSLSLTQARQVVEAQKYKEETLIDALDWPEDQTIKCIVLVSVGLVPSFCELTSAIHAIYDGQIALAGGIANDIYSSDSSPDDYGDDEDGEFDDYSKLISDPSTQNRPAYVGLAFGGENVRAASLVIQKRERTREELEERLKELKVVVDSWGECKQKIGFMFVCAGRGRILHGCVDVETSIFNQLMPGIPLNGMFSRGELGWDYPPRAAPELAKKAKYSIDPILSYTTTFAIIGFV